MRPNTRFVFLFFSVILTACGYSVFAEGDRLQFSLPENEGWTLGYENFVHAPMGGAGGTSIEEYVRPGQTVEDWSELVTVMKTFRGFGESPKSFYKKLTETREDNCPGSTRWNIIEEEDKAILYEWWATPCMGFGEQHEVAVILDGRRDRFLLRYTSMSAEMEPERRSQWIEVFKAANVIIDPNY